MDDADRDDEILRQRGDIVELRERLARVEETVAEVKAVKVGVAVAILGAIGSAVLALMLKGG